MKTVLAALCLSLLSMLCRAADLAPFNTRFVSIAMHDVVDRPGDLDDDALTSDRLVAFFDWLRGNGWTAISIDDVERARRGEKPLPARAVLLSVDDGYRSLYTRVYPLALAYRMPVVAALVGDWMAAPPGGVVRYGDRNVPRENFITWDQAREMQRSGLVEFAWHSQSLHQEILGNPQGNTMGAAVTRRYSPASGYESEAAFAERLRSDLAAGQSVLRRELGKAPRVMVWPYGRYDATGQREARAAGFAYALTLDVGMADAQARGGPADAPGLLAIPRYLPTANPTLAVLVNNLRLDPNERSVDRMACLDPSSLWDASDEVANERLGRAIERVRTLGLSGLVVDAVQRDTTGRIVSAWFPNRELPVAGDLLSRITWQMQTRAGVEVYLRLPHLAAADAMGGDLVRVRRLYEDLGAMVPASGWLVEGAALPKPAGTFKDPQPLFALTTRTQRGWAPWVVRERRAASLEALRAAGAPDAQAWDAFSALARGRPNLKLLWLAKPAADAGTIEPNPLAEFTLVPTPPDSQADGPSVDPRLLRWYTGPQPPDGRKLVKAAIDFERRGGVALGWCPDDPMGNHPEAELVAPAVSSATFPVKP